MSDNAVSVIIDRDNPVGTTGNKAVVYGRPFTWVGAGCQVIFGQMLMIGMTERNHWPAERTVIFKYPSIAGFHFIRFDSLSRNGAIGLLENRWPREK